jgi:hypothetical protein
LKESEIKIQCGSHGESDGAFVCTHLVEGEQRGFNWGVNPQDPDALSPDAYCDACDAALDAAGGWTPELEAAAGVRMVCTLCYSKIRERNWRQDDDAYDQLLDESIAYYNERLTAFKKDFRIDEHKRWDWNQESSQLVFSNDGVAAVICDVVFVGSVSTRSNTWMWAWANKSVLEGVKADIRKVRAYGEEKNFEKLAGAYWSATERDGWVMTAISTQVLGGIGAYRSPDDDGFTFMVVTAARWAT